MRRYTTEEELLFLKNLGRYREKSAGNVSVPRQALLKLYRKAALMRQNWGDVDMDTIFNYLDGIIMED